MGSSVKDHSYHNRKTAFLKATFLPADEGATETRLMSVVCTLDRLIRLIHNHKIKAAILGNWTLRF